MVDQAQQEKEKKDLFTRLADAGEDALQRLNDVPGGRRVADMLTSMRARIDDLQNRVRKIDELETRVAALERRMTERESGSTRKSGSRSRTSSVPTTPPTES